MNLEYKKLVFDQLQKCNDQTFRAREYLEGKIPLLVTQAGILLTLIVTMQDGTYAVYGVTILIAILLYACAYLPTRITHTPNPDTLIWIMERDIEKAMNEEKLVSALLPEEKREIEDFKTKFAQDEAILKLKRYLVTVGIIINALGILVWVIAVILKLHS